MSVQVSERLSGKLEPTKNGSTYINPKTMEWEKSQFEKTLGLIITCCH